MSDKSGGSSVLNLLVIIAMATAYLLMTAGKDWIRQEKVRESQKERINTPVMHAAAPTLLLFGGGLLYGAAATAILRAFTRQSTRPNGPSRLVRDMEAIRRYIAHEEPVDVGVVGGRRA